MNGIGGTTIDAALAGLSPLPRLAEPIGTPERLARIERAQELMRSNDIAALWLDASTNLSYFTGLSFRPSERLHGAVLLQDGAPLYVSPTFEVEKLKTMLSIEGGARANISNRLYPIIRDYNQQDLYDSWGAYWQ